MARERARAVTVIDRGVEALLAALMAAMCVLVFVGVGFRYVLFAPIVWAEEVAELCLVWATFLGAYLAYRRGQHIVVESLTGMLPRRWRRRLRLLIHALLALFMGMLVVQGTLYARAFLDAYSPIVELPLGVIYAALPAGAALFLIAVLADFARELRGREEG